MYYFVTRSLVDRGYIVVIPNYRLHPEVDFPAFLTDSARAVAWTVRNLRDHIPHTNNYYLVGHFAGAYNAAMLAYDERYLTDVDLSNRKINGFVGLAGLYDFLPITDHTIKPIFENTKDKQRTQPINFVDAKDPPALLVTGTADERVNPRNSRVLQQTLTDVGVGSELVFLEDAGHVDAILSLGPYFRESYTTLDRLDAFVSRTHSATYQDTSPTDAPNSPNQVRPNRWEQQTSPFRKRGENIIDE